MSVEELQKVASIDLEEEAYLKPVSNRGIGFYNLDKNTAQFQFRVTKKDKPLLISDKNVKGYAFFKAQNGSETERASTSGVLDLEFIDPMRGLVGVTVPPWFLKNVTNSTVLGELYLSLNDVGLNGKDDTVVLGTFSFSVRDSLVNQIESDIKVSYIREFDEWRTEVESRFEELKNDIGNTQSLIDTVNQIATDSIAKINKAQADAISAITDTLLSSTTSIDLERDEALRQIDAKRDAVKTDYDLAADSFKKISDDNIQSFNDNVTNANQTIDSKLTQFNETLNNDGFIAPAGVDEKINALQWQKYALTTNTGSTISLNNLDLNNPESQITGSGIFYLYTPTNGPKNVASNGILNVIYVNSNYIKMLFMPYNSNKMFIRSKVGEGKWLDWEETTNNTIDTGWLDLPLINGVVPYGITYKPAYRLINENGKNTLYLRGAVKNIASKNITIANLPSNITSLVTSNMPFPQIGSNKGGISTLIRWSVSVNGAIQIDGSSMDTSQMTPDDFYPINTNMLL